MEGAHGTLDAIKHIQCSDVFSIVPFKTISERPTVASRGFSTEICNSTAWNSFGMEAGEVGVKASSPSLDS